MVPTLFDNNNNDEADDHSDDEDDAGNSDYDDGDGNSRYENANISEDGDEDDVKIFLLIIRRRRITQHSRTKH